MSLLDSAVKVIMVLEMHLWARRNVSFLRMNNQIMRINCLLEERLDMPLPPVKVITRLVRQLETMMAKVKVDHFVLNGEFAMTYGDLEMLYMDILEKAELRLELIRPAPVVDAVHTRILLEQKTMLILQ